MVFTLVKNELIKIFSRTKTWIVAGLFLILISGLAFINYKEAKNSEYYFSPQGQIESLNQQKEYNNNRLEDLKNKSESWAQEEAVSLTKHNEDLDKSISEQQKLLDTNSEDLWKVRLNNEREDYKKILSEGDLPASSKEHYEERIKEINTALEKDKKPVESWEFDGVNFAGGLISVLGMVILVAGISVFMSDIVSGESTPPTLKFLLVQPITRGKVILSKFIAVVITVVSLICGLELAVFGVVGVIGGFGGAESAIKIGTKYAWDYNNLNPDGTPTLSPVNGSGIMSTQGEALLQSFALQILFIIACCAFVFLISSIFKSSMTTMALSVIISVATTMICAASATVRKSAHLLFFNYGDTKSVITGDIVNMYGNPNFSVGLGIGLMCSVIVVSYVLAHAIFSKKDILI